MVSLDYVARRLAGLADVAGLLDSAMWLPIRPRAQTLVSFADQTRMFLSLGKSDIFLDPECEKSYPGIERWKCLEAAFRLPFVNTPFFLTHSQYDLFGISMNVFGHFSPSRRLDIAEQKYANHYRSLVMKYLPTPLMGSGTTVYSAACYSHCSMCSEMLYKIRADGVALLDALSHWLTASTAEAATGWIMDRCKGFDCGRRELDTSAGAVTSSSLPQSAQPAVAVSHEAGGSFMNPNEWEPRFLEEYPLAICNDGTPAAYYYRAGAAQSRQWLVYLEGAGWCWDKESCDEPWKIRLGTSIEFPRTPTAVSAWANTLKGIFENSGRSPFKEWHIAYVRTCSNDAFLGDRSPQEAAAADRREPGPGWHFRGRRILEATFTDLQRRTGLGSQAGDLVLYGGCSSGGRGALVTLDHLAASFVGRADLVGLLDCPLWMPIKPFRQGQLSFDEQTRLFFPLVNASGIVSKECEQRYPGENLWKCLEGAYRLPFVRRPYFLSHPQYDVFGITMNVFGHFLPGHYLDPMQQEYAEGYRRQVLHYAPVVREGSGKAVFLPACYVHCTFAEAIFYIIDADGVTLRQALRTWLRANSASAATIDLRDTCVGFNCGKGREHTPNAKFMRQAGKAPAPARPGRAVASPLLEQAAALLV